MKWTDWVISTYGFTAPWHLAVLMAIIVVAWRCRDRRAARLASLGLLLLLVTSFVTSGLTQALISSGLYEPGDESMRQINTVTGSAYYYGKALGLVLLVLAAVVGRPVMASR